MNDQEYIIEQVDELPEDVGNLIHQGHVKDETNKGIVCNYKKVSILIKSNNGIVIGALQAYTAFAEVYVDDIWVDPSYRGQHLGQKLLEELENKFKDKEYNNINLVTSNFQAPEFYKKCGFEIEFVRTNKNNPKLSKTFFIKYFDDKIQTQGILQININEKVFIRKIKETDQDFLYDMLKQSIFSTVDSSIQVNNTYDQPAVNKYVKNWGRKEGDCGFIAVNNDLRLGAIWLRFFDSHNPGYGYINDNIPEIGIAVDFKYRSRGVGSALLKKLLQTISNTIKTISLSVDPNNPAVQLYKRFGFVECGKSGDSIIMRHDRKI